MTALNLNSLDSRIFEAIEDTDSNGSVLSAHEIRNGDFRGMIQVKWVDSDSVIQFGIWSPEEKCFIA